MPNWHPTASLKNLALRAKIIEKIRAFFAERQILEVETPLLSHASVTDIHLHSFHTDYLLSKTGKTETLYLQTSPEFAMKRLLAAGSGSIYQICKAFRNIGEAGKYHNPEFSILEWYRPGFNHHDLMDEVDEFLHVILNFQPAERMTYSELFQRYADIEPHNASAQQLKLQAEKLNLSVEQLVLDSKDDWLYLLMSHVIEPKLATQVNPIFVYDFPISQAALARISTDNPPVAERFEVYIKGIELANGFHELSDASEQRQRFITDLKQRQALGCSVIPIDENLLAALGCGFPDCAGIALGIDRLMMLAANTKDIKDVISFPVERA